MRPQPYPLIGCAQEEFDNGKYEAAKNLCLLHLKDNPRDPYAHDLLARCYFMLDKIEMSLDEHKLAVKLGPDDHLVYFNFAVTFSKLKRYNQSIKYYRRSLELEPGDYTAHVYLAQDLRDTGQISEALEEFNWVIERCPKCETAYIGLIDLVYALGDQEGAFTLFTEYAETLLGAKYRRDPGNFLRRALEKRASIEGQFKSGELSEYIFNTVEAKLKSLEEEKDLTQETEALMAELEPEIREPLCKYVGRCETRYDLDVDKEFQLER